jgi:adenosylcobinamide kinase/adenosylcobinamide-phosphate guanylyltransferase
MRELIIGGARCGKSSVALKRASASERDVIYVATATASDVEMQARIARHRAERPAHWRTIEASTQLAACLQALDRPDVFIIVDCLTLWLATVLCASNALQAAFDEPSWQHERNDFLQCLPKLRADIVVVSNEVGWGIVPDSAVARRFRDEQGWLNQLVAEQCERVTLVAAGLPLTLKASN